VIESINRSNIIKISVDIYISVSTDSVNKGAAYAAVVAAGAVGAFVPSLSAIF
jgi:hypothetical protein